MPVSATTLRRLAALSLPPEAMAGVLDIIADMQEHDERRLEAQRNRKRRSRDGHVTVPPLSQRQSQLKKVPPHPSKENTSVVSEELTTGAGAPLDERTKLFRVGLADVVAMTGRPESSVRSLVGRWLKTMNDDCRGLSRLIEDAKSANPADPVAWIEGSIRQRRGTGPPQSRNGFAAVALELSGYRHDQRGSTESEFTDDAGFAKPDPHTIDGYPAERIVPRGEQGQATAGKGPFGNREGGFAGALVESIAKHRLPRQS